MTADVLTRARRYAALGFSVIPILRPRGTGERDDGKRPVVEWKPYQREHPTDADLVRWFGRQPRNLGFVTGAISDLVTVDADSRAALEWCTAHLPSTPWRTRTARGYHLHYRRPEAAISNRTHVHTRDGHPLDLDVRGDGGFVIAPGSVHATGVLYEEAGDWTASRADVPVFDPRWVAAPPRPSASLPQRPRPTGDLVDRARAYLAAVPRPEIGAGSDVAVFTQACRLVRGFALAANVAEDLLWDWCGHRPGWTRSWVAAKVAHAEKHGSEPVGGLR